MTAMFRSTHEALRFAYTFSSEAYERPMMNRMADKPSRGGRGLSGLDGAGQAGLILAEVLQLPGHGQHALTARYAPKGYPCGCRAPCCSGHRTSKEWRAAVSVLADYVLHEALVGMLSHYRMRVALVERWFGVSMSVVSLAALCGVDRDTVAAHNERIVKVLKAEEAKAWHAIDERLRERGLIGDVEQVA